MQSDFKRSESAPELPGWVPQAAKVYLAHVENGFPIRRIAKETGCHASTVLRQVRRIETRRDDPLIDAALRRLGAEGADRPEAGMTETTANQGGMTPDEATLAREARRVLRRLCESGAVLAVAAEMDKAVVVRDTGEGGTARTAVVDAPVAQALALKEWISCDLPGRIARYRITAAGRAALSRMIAEQESRLRGFAEAQAGFDSGREAEAALDRLDRDPRMRRGKYLLAESPLLTLSRRRDRDGEPFLSDALVAAGERLREDFELAQMGSEAVLGWEDFLSGTPVAPVHPGTDAARGRLVAALRDLGPGLGDVALRCCCFLEGMEHTERHLGWAARSGKIVLRIALQRLARHYEEKHGRGGPLIG